MSIYTVENLFYSGYCLTDNDYFCLFNVKKAPLRKNVVHFDLNKTDLKFSLDKEVKLVVRGKYIDIVEEGRSIGTAKVTYFDPFKKYKDSMKVFILKEFMGKSVNDKLMFINDEKPIGCLKFRRKEKTNG